MKGSRETFVFTLAPILASALACSCSNGSAQGVQGNVSDFVKAYVDALHAKDVARSNSLVHPKSLACITSKNKNYYDLATATEMRAAIPADYKISVTPSDDHGPPRCGRIGTCSRVVEHFLKA